MLKPKKTTSSPAKDQAIKALVAKPKKRLNVELRADVYTQLKIAAAKEETSISALVSKWVSEYLSKRVNEI